MPRKAHTVLFTDASYYRPDFGQTIFPRIAAAANLTTTDAEDKDDLIAALKGVDAAVIRRGKFTRHVFQNALQLRGLVKWGVGVENIDIPAATEAGIIVANSPGNSIAVAEASLLLILAVTKNMRVMMEAAQAGARPAFDVRGHEVNGKTLGIIGLGRIGRNLARMARGLNMTLLAYDPYVAPEQAHQYGATPVDLPSLLKQADIVSLNCVLTPETRHLIGEKELAMMKPGSYLVNTARGQVVDEAALYRALKEGHLAGAGLDVFEEEPVQPDNPLVALPNVVATPHALARTWESTDRTTAMIQDAILAILDRRLPEYTLNPSVHIKRV